MQDLDEQIAAGVAAMSQELPPGAVAGLAWLLTELGRWNRRINLSAIRDQGAMISGHVLDSLSLRPLLEGTRIIDVGTGAGFPGLPLAIAEPGRRFVLLDSHGRKVAFVRHVIGGLKLENVEAVQARAERFAPDRPFDTVVARALAPLCRIVELSAHLVAENGVLLAQKGRYPAEELEDLNECSASWTYRVTELEIPGLPPHSRHVVRITRSAG